MSRYLNESDDGVLAFATNFRAVAADNSVSIGLDAGEIALYVDALAVYSGALNAARARPTRGPLRTLQKNEAKENLVKLTRKYAMSAGNYAKTTDDLREQLGLTIREKHPQPSPIPSRAPQIVAAATALRAVMVMIDQVPSGRPVARPRGVKGVALLTHVGPTAPQGPGGWTPYGSASGRQELVEFDPSLPPGTRVWVTGYYFNARGENGPAAAPAQAFLGATLPTVVGTSGGDVAEAEAFPRAA